MIVFIVILTALAAQPGSYSYYNCFMNEPTLGGAYTDGMVIEGPFRANGPVRLTSASPGGEDDVWFYSFTLSSDYYVYGWGSQQSTEPHCEDLWIQPYDLMQQGPPWFELGASPLPFGADQVDWMVIKAAAVNYGLYLTAAEVPDGSRIILEGNELRLLTQQTGTPVVYDLAELEEPVVWLDNQSGERVYIKGDGAGMGISEQFILGTPGNIYLAGHMDYDLDQGGLLGLVSVYGDLVIADDPGSSDWPFPYQIETDQDFTFSGSMMALEGKFFAENFTQPSPGVTLKLYGGMQIQQEGYTGTVTSGFEIDYDYDHRLLTEAPPWYPQYQLSGVSGSPAVLSGYLSANPFSASTVITLSEPCCVELYDFSGRKVLGGDAISTLTLDGSRLARGVYFFRAVSVSGETITMKAVRI